MTKRKAKSEKSVRQILARARRDETVDRLVSENAVLRTDNQRLREKIEHLEWEVRAQATMVQRYAARTSYGETVQ